MAVEEARRNLELKLPQRLAHLRALVRSVRLMEHRATLDYPEGLAGKDRPILQAALACRATHLLTGDLKGFGRFMNRPEATMDVRIQTVAQFLDQIR